MNNFNEFHDEFQNHAMPYHQLSPPQMTTYSPYWSYPASHFTKFYVIPNAALQNNYNFNNLHTMISPESLASPPLLIPTMCRCELNVHQLRDSPSDQALVGYQNFSQQPSRINQNYQNYQQIPQNYPYTISTSLSATYNNDEPDELPQSSAESQTEKPSKLHNKKNKFTKSTSNKKLDSNTFKVVIFKDKGSIIPRKYENIHMFRLIIFYFF
jgi:hypothetical protein